MRFRLIDGSSDVGNAPEHGGPISQNTLDEISVALSVQLNRDVAIAWGGNYIVDSTPPTAKALVDGEVACLLVDSLPDAPGAVAYHDVTGNEVPIVYLARTQCNSLTVGSDSVSSALSHELCEAAGDPFINAWRDDGNGTEYAQELCDAVQESGYKINEIAVSNFVLPAFFAPGSTGPFDFLNSLSGPLQTMVGGYQLVRIGAGNETQVHGTILPSKLARKQHPVSRTYRRGARL